MMRTVLTSLVLSFSFSLSSIAAEMAATIYDDGKACPGGCDSHVVFSERHNGTLNAYDPAGSRNDPKPCRSGEKCRICFTNSETSCLEAIYRGGGPPENRFDFTPAFFSESCDRSDLPSPLLAKCQELKKTAAILKTRINCFENQEHQKCQELMVKVKERKKKDNVLYEECKSLGQEAFNEQHKNEPELQRELDCAYAKRRKTLSNEKKFRPLLDGACREGTYVGGRGFDCCSGNVFQASIDFKECSIFYPEP